MIENWGGHRFQQPGECDIPHFEGVDCFICDSHLQWCLLCKEAEGDLAEFCPNAFPIAG